MIRSTLACDAFAPRALSPRSSIKKRAKSLGLAVSVLLGFGTTPNAPAQAGSGWSGASAVSAVNQPDPTRGSQLNDVASNASGLTLAAWDQFTYSNGGNASIGVAIMSNGRWSAPFTLSGTTGFSTTPRVAVGADGTMAVSWTYQDPATLPAPLQKIQVAVRSAGSTAWLMSTLDAHAPGGVQLTQSAPIAVDQNGNVTAAWSLWDGTRNRVQVATKLNGQGWSAPVDVAPFDSALYPALAINENGDTGLAFAVSPYPGYAMTNMAKYAFRRGATGSWSPPVQISEVMPSTTGYISAPRVALNAQGVATVAYLGNGVEVVRELVDQQGVSSWTPPFTAITTPSPGSSYQAIDLAMDRAGNATLAASIFDANVQVQRASVWVAQSGATYSSSWTAPIRLTDPAALVDAYAARTVISPDGALAFVGWIDHYHGTVQVARRGGAAWQTSTMQISTIGRGTALSSFQEVLNMSAGSGTSARAIWKNAKNGTQTMAASYGN